MKEKTADEMFDELGYKKQEDKYRIEYFLKQNYTHFVVTKRIAFYKVEKDICLEQWNVTEGIRISTNITMKELQAINKKCQDKGWLE